LRKNAYLQGDTMKKFVLALLILIAISPLLPVKSQVPRCEPSAAFEYMATLKASGDDAKDMTTLLGLRDVITAQNLVCSGYTFEGKSNQAIGPIELLEGKYLMTVTTTSALIMKGNTLDGKCSVGRDEIDGDSIYAFTAGNGDEGAAVLIDSDGCRVIFTTEYLTRPWKITIEPLN